MKLKEVLSKLMEKNDLSLSVLSKEVNISKSCLHGYLQGANPGAMNLIKLSEYFDVSIDYLIRGDKVNHNIYVNKERLKLHSNGGVYELTLKKLKTKEPV